MNHTRHNRGKNWVRSNLVLALLIGVFVVTASLTAFLAFKLVRNAILKRVGGPGELSLSEDGGVQDILGIFGSEDLNTPLQGNHGPPPQPWDEESRVTILVLGVDSRDENDGAPRSDSLILFTVDPKTMTAGMLSIPRDLWVEIPGHGYSKINQAYTLGELDRFGGGGANLAMNTIEDFLDIDVQYYVSVDFNAFIRIIDEIDGVPVIVPYQLEVDPLGDHNNTLLEPGEQVLTGELALAYARARNTIGSDFDRAQRQQQVILGIRDRVLNLGLLPRLLSRAPVIYTEIAQGIHTNLTLQQIIKLAWIAQQIDRDNIAKLQIGPAMTTNSWSWDGQSILLPIFEEIMKLRDVLFKAEEEVENATPVPQFTELERVSEENSSITILNGTYTAGLAARTNDYLLGLDLNVMEVGNSDELYENTTIIDYTGKPYTIAYLSGLMNIPQQRVYHSFDPASETDIIIYLGNDWVNSDTLP